MPFKRVSKRQLWIFTVKSNSSLTRSFSLNKNYILPKSMRMRGSLKMRSTWTNMCRKLTTMRKIKLWQLKKRSPIETIQTSTEMSKKFGFPKIKIWHKSSRTDLKAPIVRIQVLQKAIKNNVCINMTKNIWTCSRGIQWHLNSRIWIKVRICRWSRWV